MSLKTKLTTLATEKIAKKIISKDKVDNMINSALTKIGKASGQKTSSEYVHKSKKNCLIIKAKSYSLGTMAGLFVGKTPDMRDHLGRYQILDTSGKIKYKSAAENTVTNREILDLYDAEGKKIGYVKEHLISVGIPLFEKDVQKCSVFLGNEKIAVLKKSVSFGDLNFEALEGNVEISHEKGKETKIYYRKKLLAKLNNVPFTLKDGYVEKFVMEYSDTSNEIIAVLLATAIDLIN